MTALRAYQERMAQFVVDKKRTACWVDVGLGKTLATLTAIKRHSWLVGRVLVVAPKRVAAMTWPDEIRKWFDGELTYRAYTGDAKERRRFRNESGDEDITIISTEALVSLVKEHEDDWREKLPWNWVIFDESSQYKSAGRNGSARFKAALFVARRAEYVTELTGTPATNGLADLYGQMFLLDDGEALGRTLTAFRNTFFDYSEYSRQYTLKKGMDKLIHRKCQPYVLALEAKDYVDLPEVVYNDILVHLPEDLREQYERLEEEFLIELEQTEIPVMSAAALSMKTRQLCAGFCYDESGKARYVHELKMDALEMLLDALDGEPLLLGYQFRAEWDMVKRRFPFAESADNEHVFDRWRKRKVRLLCGHPASIGHGLNIADGGCNTLWLSETWSLEHIRQFEGRLGGARGVGKKPVVHRILVADSIEERVAAARVAKEATMHDLIQAVKHRG